MARFRKKPVVIDAILNQGDWRPIYDWLQSFVAGGLVFQMGQNPPVMRSSDGVLSVPIAEGTMRVEVGDWIIRGVKGEFYPIKDEIFRETYEAVKEES